MADNDFIRISYPYNTDQWLLRIFPFQYTPSTTTFIVLLLNSKYPITTEYTVTHQMYCYANVWQNNVGKTLYVHRKGNWE